MPVKSATARGLTSGLEPGLVLLNNTSFSAVSNQAINPFTANYDAYKIIFTLTSTSGDPVMSMRIRSGTTDNSAGDYYFGGVQNRVDLTTVSDFRGNGATSFALNTTSSVQAARFFTEVSLINPFAATATKINYQGFNGNSSGFFMYSATGIVANSISYDGINFIASTGTMTGKVVTYGYNL